MNETEPIRWFSPNVVYRGEARAEFEDPAATAIGPGEARFDECGRERLSMEVRRWETEEDLGGNVAMAVLGGVRPEKHEGVTRLFLEPGSRNRCLTFTVDAADGLFRVRDPIYYWQLADIMTPGPEATVRFSLSKWGTFEPATASGSSKYWAVPLTNFLSNYTQRVHPLDEHPLRLQPFEEPGPNASEQERAIARHNVQPRITFTFAEQLGFIEPLPDLDVRAKKLKEKGVRETVTAVMVGRVPEGASAADLDGWFPFDLLRVLSFATGTEASGLWIELRTAEGRLERRVHGRFRRSCFTPGHRVIRDEISRGIGGLLTTATTSNHWATTELRVALHQSVLAGRHQQLLEERIGEVSKGLDGLGAYFNVRRKALIKELPKAYRQPVRQAIGEACSRLRALKAQAEKEGEHAVVTVLGTIESRMTNASNIRRSFGEVVAELTRKFGYPDANIVEWHYTSLGTGRTWVDALSDYRNIALHGSYFASRGRPIDQEGILAIAFHLHDILIRLVLTMLGYEGKYQPPNVRVVSSRQVDWVTQKTTAAQLGY